MKYLVKLMLCLALFSAAGRMGFSRGDKVIPQVIAGPGWATKFDLTNISSSKPISGTMHLAFFHNNGTPWVMQTPPLGTGASFPLTLQPRQTIRVQALGNGTLDTGYAVIYDEEPTNTEYSEDYVLGISVFYQVVNPDGKITETVTVSVPQPTAAAAIPIEMNEAQGIYSGMAIVNWAGADNEVQIQLYSENGASYALPVKFSMLPGTERAQFFDQEGLFPGLKSFKGMAEFTAQGPFILLSLLETYAADGNPQYATLVPVDREALRRNSYVAVLQAATDNKPYMPFDVDAMTVDFYRTTGELRVPPALTESYSWDLLYGYGAPDSNSRYLQPVNGAMMAALGFRDDGPFDNISLPNLKALNYTTDIINLSGLNLIQKFTFAIRTDLGNYAKARIIRIIDTSDGVRNYKDLVLELVVYR